jgi:hypothetical protein
MALKARKSAVENSNLDAVAASQESVSPDGHAAWNFPMSHDTVVALGKPASLQILLGVSPEVARANVTLVGKQKGGVTGRESR